MKKEVEKFLTEFGIDLNGIIVEKGRKLFLVPKEVNDLMRILR